MSDYLTREQRMAFNNDGMDPDWLPNPPPPRDPNVQCVECGARFVKALKERDRDWFTSPKDIPADLPNPTISMPKEKLIQFRNDYATVAEFTARMLGTTVEKLCVADMMFKLNRVAQLEEQLADCAHKAESVAKVLAAADRLAHQLEGLFATGIDNAHARQVLAEYRAARGGGAG